MEGISPAFSRLDEGTGLGLAISKKLGYRADLAANGAEVLQALERQPYDVVLMDIKMPEMDG